MAHILSYEAAAHLSRRFSCYRRRLMTLPGTTALAALHNRSFARLKAGLKLVPMPLGEVLYESGATLRHVYFPTDSIVSLLYVMEDGASAEIAVVGNEGIDRHLAVHGRRNHAEPGHRAERRPRLPADGQAAQGGIQPRRRRCSTCCCATRRR